MSDDILWAGTRGEWVDRRMKTMRWGGGDLRIAPPAKLEQIRVRWFSKYDAAYQFLTAIQRSSTMYGPTTMDKLHTLLSDAFIFASDEEFDEHLRDALDGIPA